MPNTNPMTKARRQIRERRIAEPASQPEVVAFLAWVDRHWARVYRLMRLRKFDANIAEVQQQFLRARVASPDWFTAGAQYLQIIADRVALDAIASLNSSKPDDIPGKHHDLRVPVSRLAALFLREGRLPWNDESNPLMAPAPLWSKSEFAKLARTMHWGDSANDVQRDEKDWFFDFMEIPEETHPFPDLPHFRQMLNLMAGCKDMVPESADEGPQKSMAVHALLIDLKGTDKLLEWFHFPWSAINEHEMVVRGLRRILPGILSKLISLWKTVEPRAHEFPDITPADFPC